MKVKCKICGLKGYYDTSKISEYYSSRYLHISVNCKSFMNCDSVFICRPCLSKILEQLRFEQHLIDNLYKPEIKTPKIEKRKKRKQSIFARFLGI